MLYLDVYNPALKAWLDENIHLDDQTLINAMVNAKYEPGYAQAVVSMAKRDFQVKRGATTQFVEASVKSNSVSSANQEAANLEPADHPDQQPIAQEDKQSVAQQSPRVNNEARWAVMPGDEANGFVPCAFDRLNENSNWVTDSKGKRYPISYVSKDKGIIHVLGVLTDSECKAIIESSKPTMTKSKVIDESKAHGDVSDKRRDSLGGFVHPGGCKVVDKLDQLLSDLFGHPKRNGESLQVLNYHPGGQYEAHLDYFQSNTAYGAEVVKRAGNRVTTILIYLNDVEEGGSTGFPKHGLKFRPIKGSALYFESFNGEQGAFDRHSLHSGDPVTKGEKWVATRWVHSKPWV